MSVDLEVSGSLIRKLIRNWLVMDRGLQQTSQCHLLFSVIMI